MKTLARLFERYPDKPPRLLTIDLVFEPRDCWIGVYWTPSRRQLTYHDAGEFLGDVVDGVWRGADVYVTLIPMLPFRVQYRRHCTIDERLRITDLFDAVMP